MIIRLDDTDKESEDFKNLNEIIQKNHYHRYDRSTAYQYLKQMPKGRLHIRSALIEIVRYFQSYNGISDDCNAKQLASIIYWPFREDEECLQLFDNYLKEQEMDKLYNYHRKDLIYWEYRLTTWMNAGILLQDDLIFDTYMIFNTRKLLGLGLSMPAYYRQRNVVAFESFRRLWPEIWEFIPNTDIRHSDNYVFDNTAYVNLSCGKITAKNENDNTESDVFVRFGNQNGYLGFAKSFVSKGESIDYTVPLQILKNGVYVVQVEVYVPHTLRASGNDIEYEILLNGNHVYSCYLSAFQNKSNQINIIHNFVDVQNPSVSVILKVNKDYYTMDGAVGLFVPSIHCAIQPHYPVPEKTKVYSTFELIKKMNGN